jgi:glycerate kinase
VGAVKANVSADTAEYWGGGGGGGVGGALQSLFSAKTKLELTLTFPSRNIEQLHVRVSSTLWPRMKESSI